jgi:hypothetical protein
MLELELASMEARLILSLMIATAISSKLDLLWWTRRRDKQLISWSFTHRWSKMQTTTIGNKRSIKEFQRDLLSGGVEAISISVSWSILLSINA